MATKTLHGLGRKGELLATSFLEKSGYSIIAANIKLGNLEIDLIASHNGWLYFFEIKTKSTPLPSNDDNLVTQKQLTNLKKAAHIYAARNKINWQKIKFDLIVVYIDKLTKKGCLQRYRDIFS